MGKVIGNYEIIRQIGEGGFGRTYEARHRILGEKACLKQNINISPKDEEILKQEAKLLWDIHHHSLPAMRDFFQIDDGSYVMAMSFIEGKALDKSVKKHKAINPEDVAWVSQRLLHALYYLHHRGIVHSDVKPPNIIVQAPTHNAVLVDYGLSISRPTSTTKPIGYTNIFAAPEIVDGKPPIPESDMFSLGKTMIYALGGDPVSNSFPDHVPEPLKEYCNDLVRYDPVHRPNWQKEDLVKKLSDVRLEAFGRRSTLGG